MWLLNSGNAIIYTIIRSIVFFMDTPTNNGCAAYLRNIALCIFYIIVIETNILVPFLYCFICYIIITICVIYGQKCVYF